MVNTKSLERTNISFELVNETNPLYIIRQIGCDNIQIGLLRCILLFTNNARQGTPKTLSAISLIVYSKHYQANRVCCFRCNLLGYTTRLVMPRALGVTFMAFFYLVIHPKTSNKFDVNQPTFHKL